MPKTGTIGLPDGAKPINCLILQISETGAHLKVIAPLDLPRAFIFSAVNQSPRKASVVWWDVDAVGIHFNEK
ncbi:MAG: hypothetical protein HC869_19315 [Rhodospirillales bacterium]|nr:hypothetical protein [Rhodospirillales bacterium]